MKDKGCITKNMFIVSVPPWCSLLGWAEGSETGKNGSNAINLIPLTCLFVSELFGVLFCFLAHVFELAKVMSIPFLVPLLCVPSIPLLL